MGDEEERFKTEEDARANVEGKAKMVHEGNFMGGVMCQGYAVKDDAKLGQIVTAEEEANAKAAEKATIKREEAARVKAEEEVKTKTEEEPNVKADEETSFKAEGDAM